MIFRPRRLRTGKLLRNFTADIKLNLNDYVYPFFLKTGKNFTKPVSSMPGISQVSPDVALEEVKKLSEQGIKNFMPFAVIDANKKDEIGSEALNPENPVNEFIRLVKKSGTEALIISDLCYCEYTSHGHCGILSHNKEETVDNDQTLDILAKQAVVLAENGADVIAPSGMMDGMIDAIRTRLDEGGFLHIPILSYSSKYASNLYGPFRDAAEGAPSFGDRKAYQMDFRRSREFLTEAELDLSEGADMLMVKPAMFYLDVITAIKDTVAVPIGAYQVSGEYSMMHAAANNDWLNLQKIALESLYCLKRAGADFVITYFAKDLPGWFKANE